MKTTSHGKQSLLVAKPGWFARRQPVIQIGSTILGGVFLATLVYFAGRQGAAKVVSPNVAYLALAFGSSVALFATDTWRWHLVSRHIEGAPRGGFLDFFFYFIMGSLVGLVASQGLGNAATRVVLLRRFQRISLKTGVASVALDKLFDALLVALFAAPTGLFLAGITSVRTTLAIYLISLGLAVLVLRMGGVALIKQFHRLVRVALRYGGSFLTRVRRVDEEEAPEDSILERVERLEAPLLLHLSLLTVLRYVLSVLRSFFIVLALHLSFGLPIMFLGMVLAQMAILIAVTPGAVGFLEGGWYVGLVAVGASSSDIWYFLLGQRVYIYLIVAVCALFSFLAVRMRDAIVNGRAAKTF